MVQQEMIESGMNQQNPVLCYRSVRIIVIIKNPMVV